ncbi:hypothetical protein HYH02_005029 [Chlamydomonas schloesseri]|uniref:Cytochrome P450 n=1 Tax=Chlamydomonas schloesseri TaxID=2026947 RepID=A0A835WNL4_9CHLO|nr:hypothetical protein HYH02_005029 [Chlamydomonas schloesseri]|eukprot:KAG2450528.1 hypothetical protein HYH02_005029 [Chlamydomonas schloesseri]
MRAKATQSVAELPLPEGSLGLPAVGETLELITNGDTFGASRRERHGDVYKTNILGAPTVMVYGEEAVRAVLAAEDKLVASDWPEVTSTLVGPDSLNLLTGPRHGAVKRALSEAFSDKALRRHVPAIAALVQEYVAGWAAGAQPTPGFESCQLLSQAVFDRVVLGGAGGRDRAAQLQGIMAALQAGFNTPPVQLPFTDYGKAVAARQEFGALVTQAIQRSRQQQTTAAASASSAAANPSAQATFDCAMADVVAAAASSSTSSTSTTTSAATAWSQPPVPLPDSLLVDNAAAALFGNASMGPSLAKALQHLAANAADGGNGVMAALRKEQQDIMTRRGPAITAEVLDDMTYGGAVARELLRITPAVPAVFRLALVDFELQGRRIPKGWRVWCHLGDSVTRYNKDHFRPERWLQAPGGATGSSNAANGAPSAAAATAPAAAAQAGGCPMHGGGSGGGSATSAKPAEYSLPFGSGVRSCLGRNLVMSELLVALAVLARGYEWEAVNPEEQWGVVPSPAPKEGLRMRLRPRA